MTILGPVVTMTKPIAGTYLLELGFYDPNGDYCYDTKFLSLERLLEYLPLLSNVQSGYGISTSDLPSDLVSVIYSNWATPDELDAISLLDLAYVDSNSVLHYFDFNLDFVKQNHPELLL